MTKKPIQKQRIILNDSHLDLYRNVLDTSAAQTLFERLENTLNWKQETIRIFGRDVLSPRLQSFYGDNGIGYHYSGRTFTAEYWTSELLMLKNFLSNLLQQDFNAVLCNLYRTGEDSMGWHSDNEPELGEAPIIASVSLGGTRSFNLRAAQQTRQCLSLPLEHNSVVVMPRGFQDRFQHSISKTKKKVAPRINLTFRHFI